MKTPIKIFFSKTNNEHINIGMATHPPAHKPNDHGKYDYKTLVYRIYNGEFYGLSGGTKTYEKSHTNDVIKFTFDSKNKQFSFQKVVKNIVCLFFGYYISILNYFRILMKKLLLKTPSEVR